MKLLDLYREIKDLKLKGNVVVPFRKSIYGICRIGQFSIIPDVTVTFKKDVDKDEHISVNEFIEVINKLVRRAGHCGVEMIWDGKKRWYDLTNVYIVDETLYLMVG